MQTMENKQVLEPLSRVTFLGCSLPSFQVMTLAMKYLPVYTVFEFALECLHGYLGGVTMFC